MRAIIDRAMSYDEPVRRRGGHRDFLTECGAKNRFRRAFSLTRSHR